MSFGVSICERDPLRGEFCAPPPLRGRWRAYASRRGVTAALFRGELLARTLQLRRSTPTPFPLPARGRGSARLESRRS